MPSFSTCSTPERSCTRLDPPEKRHMLPLPSTCAPIPTLILPPARSDVEYLPHNFNTVKLPNFSGSPLTVSCETDPLRPSFLSSSLLSPPADIPEIYYCAHMAHQNKEGASIRNSDQKMYTTPENFRTRMPAPLIHQLQLYSPIQDITMLELPQSIFDAGCLSHHSDM